MSVPQKKKWEAEYENSNDADENLDNLIVPQLDDSD